MSRCPKFLNLSLLFLVAGCEAAPPQEPESVSNVNNPHVSGPQQVQLVRDRVQAHYRTSVTKTTDGTEFSRGNATLEIRYAPERPLVTFTLQARAPSDQLTAVLPLDGAALEGVAAGKVDLAVSAPGVVRRSHGVEPVFAPPPRRLVLERAQEAGKRARFHGRVLDEQGASSAEFQTELAISCLVPPEMLGAEPNGHAEGPGVTVLVADEEFKSSFCAKFSGLL
jgi:hypothetical protein